MINRRICVTDYDILRLSAMISNPNSLVRPEPQSLESIRREITRAKIVAAEDVPSDIVTMNSTVRVMDLDAGEEETCTVVFPSDADVSSGRISILAPMGTAMLGRKVGDELTWQVPDGYRRLQILEVVYQPEASGHYHV